MAFSIGTSFSLIFMPNDKEEQTIRFTCMPNIWPDSLAFGLKKSFILDRKLIRGVEEVIFDGRKSFFSRPSSGAGALRWQVLEKR